MKKIIAILHNDKAYVEKLMEYMKNQDSFFYDILAFSEAELFLAYENENAVTLLLCNEAYKGKFSVKTEKILYLTDAPAEEDDQIFMYQSAKQIIEQIGKKSNEARMYKKAEENKKKQIVGIFSPYEGCFRSIMPELMAACYGKEKNVLLLSMNPFYDGMLFTAEEDWYGISELIYYSKQGKEIFAQKLGSCMRRREGIDLIAGCEHYTDLFEMTEKECRLLMEVLLEDEEHDVIVLDFGCGTCLMEEALLGCDVVYKLAYPNSSYERRDNQLERQLLQSIPKEKAEYIRTVSMPEAEIEGEELQIKSLLLSPLGEFTRRFISQDV